MATSLASDNVQLINEPTFSSEAVFKCKPQVGIDLNLTYHTLDQSTKAKNFRIFKILELLKRINPVTEANSAKIAENYRNEATFRGYL